MNTKKLRVAFFAAYFFIVILLTRLICIVDNKLEKEIIIRNLGDTGGIVETEKPQ